MKATLEFDLPEDGIAHQQAIDGGKWELVVWNLRQACMKHGEFYDRKVTAEDISKKIFEEMDAHNLTFSP